jgi:hypothetical protein
MLRHLTNEAVLNEGHKRETQRSATERRERLTSNEGKRGRSREAGSGRRLRSSLGSLGSFSYYCVNPTKGMIKWEPRAEGEALLLQLLRPLGGGRIVGGD